MLASVTKVVFAMINEHIEQMPGNFTAKVSDQNQIVDMKIIGFEFASNNGRAYEIGVFQRAI
ncbi:hypothetical protein JJE66_34490 [Bradyrhizobium diazoefficiens]|uniref:hypothetical protein n=1 Tax=Bradyrhizobium diazoefficiens TaxID=1355477 RepID=UPI00190DCB17|nr:hypothetical protein [Bradyrhizobium diazoefficiens]MBK3666311.1 hypothetical protein [Bradyrhizobium diazoefficiens]